MTKKQSTDKNGETETDGKKKRSKLSLAPLILLLLLLIFILFLLFYLGGKPKDAGAADSTRIADSLRRINDPLYLDSLRRADSVRLSDPKYLDSLRTADSIRRLSESRLSDSLLRANSARLSDPNYLDSLRRASSTRLSDPKYLDSLRRADSIRTAEIKRSDSLHRADSIRTAEAARLDSLRRADSIRVAESKISDSSRIADSLAKLVSDSAALRAAACARDTVAPWVYADPSGGLHRRAVSVRLIANKVCRVEWSFDGVKGWKVYDGKPIEISKPATIYYKASDDCGKKMDVRSKRYEFDMAASRCPAGTELAKADGKEICVDVYEWPNKKGAVPQSYVSLYQAMDSCFSVRKRLCSAEEWTAACGGPERWKYAYGESYEWNACATRDSMAQRSGSRPECRGYYGLFDMSGNLAEWTSTPAPQDKSFNNVMGGFWTSGNQSRCADARYSYYPQNRHNPVGFRCCVDAPPAAGGRR